MLQVLRVLNNVPRKYQLGAIATLGLPMLIMVAYNLAVWVGYYPPSDWHTHLVSETANITLTHVESGEKINLQNNSTQVGGVIIAHYAEVEFLSDFSIFWKKSVLVDGVMVFQASQNPILVSTGGIPVLGISVNSDIWEIEVVTYEPFTS